MAQLISRISLAQRLRFESTVVELFQEANVLHTAGFAVNEYLILRIVRSKKKREQDVSSLEWERLRPRQEGWVVTVESGRTAPEYASASASLNWQSLRRFRNVAAFMSAINKLPELSILGQKISMRVGMSVSALKWTQLININGVNRPRK